MRPVLCKLATGLSTSHFLHKAPLTSSYFWPALCRHRSLGTLVYSNIKNEQITSLLLRQSSGVNRLRIGYWAIGSLKNDKPQQWYQTLNKRGDWRHQWGSPVPGEAMWLWLWNHFLTELSAASHHLISPRVYRSHKILYIWMSQNPSLATNIQTGLSKGNNPAIQWAVDIL